jgi:hypothetical protein
MLTFWQWLSQLSLLRETYFSFDPRAYNALFDSELEKVIARVKEPQALERLRGFDWLSYIAASVWHAGFLDKRERDEKSHDIAVKLLMGQLFRGYDPRIHGPMELRFKASVANGIRNMTQKERNRRRNVPTVPIRKEFTPGSVTPDDLPAKPARDDDSKVIEGFRELVLRRLGGLWACRAGLASGRRRNEIPGRLPVARVSGQVDDQEGRGEHQGVGEGVLSGRSRAAANGREGDGRRIGNDREEEDGDGGEAGGGGVMKHARAKGFRRRPASPSPTWGKFSEGLSFIELLLKNRVQND